MKKTVLFVAALSMLGFWGCQKAQFDLEGAALLVVNGGSHSLSVIDLDDYSLRDVLVLPEEARFPHHVYLSPDKERFAVSITDTDLSAGHVHGSSPGKNYRVMVFDASNGKRVETIEVEGMAHNAVFSPDGAELWFGESASSESKVHVYDTKRFKEQHVITVGSGLSEVTFSADGSRVYAANTMGNTLSIIDPATKAVVKTLAVGNAPVGAWPASNGRMYVDNEESYSLTEVDVLGDSVISTISLGSKPGYAAYHAGNDQVWATAATLGQVLVYSQQGGVWGNPVSIATGEDAHAIAFSPDGSLAFVSNQGSGTVSVIDTQTLVKLQDIAVELMPNGLVILD